MVHLFCKPLTSCEFITMPQLRGIFSDQEIPINMKVIICIKWLGLKTVTTKSKITILIKEDLELIEN